MTSYLCPVCGVYDDEQCPACKLPRAPTPLLPADDCDATLIVEQQDRDIATLRAQLAGSDRHVASLSSSVADATAREFALVREHARVVATLTAERDEERNCPHCGGYGWTTEPDRNNEPMQAQCEPCGGDGRSPAAIIAALTADVRRLHLDSGIVAIEHGDELAGLRSHIATLTRERDAEHDRAEGLEGQVRDLDIALRAEKVRWAAGQERDAAIKRAEEAEASLSALTKRAEEAEAQATRSHAICVDGAVHSTLMHRFEDEREGHNTALRQWEIAAERALTAEARVDALEHEIGEEWAERSATLRAALGKWECPTCRGTGKTTDEVCPVCCWVSRGRHAPDCGLSAVDLSGKTCPTCDGAKLSPVATAALKATE